MELWWFLTASSILVLSYLVFRGFSRQFPNLQPVGVFIISQEALLGMATGMVLPAFPNYYPESASYGYLSAWEFYGVCFTIISITLLSMLYVLEIR